MRGIPAGIIIAALVWTAPLTKYFRFITIFFFIYFIALGDFTHVLVDSCEMAYEVINGNADFFTYLFKFLIPTGIGNIIGGTFIFTVLIYNQVKKELQMTKKHIGQTYLKSLQVWQTYLTIIQKKTPKIINNGKFLSRKLFLFCQYSDEYLSYIAEF